MPLTLVQSEKPTRIKVQEFIPTETVASVYRIWEVGPSHVQAAFSDNDRVKIAQKLCPRRVFKRSIEELLAGMRAAGHEMTETTSRRGTTYINSEAVQRISPIKFSIFEIPNISVVTFNTGGKLVVFESPDALKAKFPHEPNAKPLGKLNKGTDYITSTLTMG